jgi:hypothetical protein
MKIELLTYGKPFIVPNHWGLLLLQIHKRKGVFCIVVPQIGCNSEKLTKSTKILPPMFIIIIN